MPRTDFVCAPALRVRWAEVDMQKIVFNGHYLTYIDSAIAEYWREIGLPYPHGYVERYGSDIYLRKATLEYLGSARYDDLLTVCCRVARLGRSSMTFVFEIYRDDEAFEEHIRADYGARFNHELSQHIEEDGSVLTHLRALDE